jgi:hypothetical protein
MTTCRSVRLLFLLQPPPAPVPIQGFGTLALKTERVEGECLPVGRSGSARAPANPVSQKPTWAFLLVL